MNGASPADSGARRAPGVPLGACALTACRGETVVRYRLRRFRVEECRRCGMRFRQPFPTAAEIRAMYEDPAYHAAAYFSAQERADAGSPEVRIHASALDWLDGRPECPPSSVRALLDVGCGTGLFLRLARERAWRVAGVELSEALAEQARARHRLDVHCGDFLEVPLAPGSYHAIAMWDFLEHVVDPEAVLDRAGRLLAPGGYLVVFTIDTSSLFNALGHAASRAVGRRADTLLELLYDARHNYYFTRRSLAGLLARSGFSTVASADHRAYLGRWLAEPAPLAVKLAGDVVDLASVAMGRQYRQLLYCQPLSRGSRDDG